MDRGKRANCIVYHSQSLLTFGCFLLLRFFPKIFKQNPLPLGLYGSSIYITSRQDRVFLYPPILKKCDELKYYSEGYVSVRYYFVWVCLGIQGWISNFREKGVGYFTYREGKILFTYHVKISTKYILLVQPQPRNGGPSNIGYFAYFH